MGIGHDGAFLTRSNAARAARPRLGTIVEQAGVWWILEPSILNHTASSKWRAVRSGRVQTLGGPTHVPRLIRTLMGRQRPDRACHLVRHRDDGHILRPPFH